MKSKRNAYIFIEENTIEIVVPFRIGLNVLIKIHI